MTAAAPPEDLTGLPPVRTFDECLSLIAQAPAPALACDDFAWDYTELIGQVGRYSSALSAAGIHAGDVVAVLANSRPEALVVFLACCRIGALYLGLNPKYTPGELGYVCDDAAPGLLIALSDQTIDPATRTRLTQFLGSLTDRTAVVTAGYDGPHRTLEAFLAHGASAGTSRPVTSHTPERPCAIVYTSGSTGKPKGALLSEAGALRSARLSWRHWYGGAHGLRTVAQHPINHVGWLVCECLTVLVSGGYLYFRERFSGGGTLRLIEEQRLNLWLAFPSMLMLAMQSPEWESRDLTSLQRIAFGTSPSLEMLKRLRERTDAVCSVSYGLTEAHGGAVTVTEDDAPIDVVAGTIGKPVPGITLRVSGPDGMPPRPGEPGELMVHDSSIFLGYLNRPDATAATIENGWLHTGDVVVELPDGNLRMVGRLKEMFKSGGYNVYPSEIEMHLGDYPDVVHAAVVEAPDPLWEHVGIAFLTVHSPAKFEISDLTGFLRGRLANYKLPKRFVLLDELPQLPNGKVDKSVLRAQAKLLSTQQRSPAPATADGRASSPT